MAHARAGWLAGWLALSARARLRFCFSRLLSGRRVRREPSSPCNPARRSNCACGFPSHVSASATVAGSHCAAGFHTSVSGVSDSGLRGPSRRRYSTAPSSACERAWAPCACEAGAQDREHACEERTVRRSTMRVIAIARRCACWHRRYTSTAQLAVARVEQNQAPS